MMRSTRFVGPSDRTGHKKRDIFKVHCVGSTVEIATCNSSKKQKFSSQSTKSPSTTISPASASRHQRKRRELPAKLDSRMEAIRHSTESNFHRRRLPFVELLRKLRDSPLVVLQCLYKKHRDDLDTTWFLAEEFVSYVQGWKDKLLQESGLETYTDDLLQLDIAWIDKELVAREEKLVSSLNERADSRQTFADETRQFANTFWLLFQSEFPAFTQPQIALLKKRCAMYREKTEFRILDMVHGVTRRGRLKKWKRVIPYQYGLFRELPMREYSFVPTRMVKNMKPFWSSELTSLNRCLCSFMKEKSSITEWQLVTRIRGGAGEGNDEDDDGTQYDEHGNAIIADVDQPPEYIILPPPGYIIEDNGVEGPTWTSHPKNGTNTGMSLYKTVTPGGRKAKGKAGSIQMNSNIVRRNTVPKTNKGKIMHKQATGLQKQVVDVICGMIRDAFGKTPWFVACMELLKDIPNDRLLPGIPCSHIWWTRNPKFRFIHHDTNTLPPAFVFCADGNFLGGELIIQHPGGRTEKIPLREGVIAGGAWAQRPHCVEATLRGFRQTFVVYLDHRVLSKSYRNY